MRLLPAVAVLLPAVGFALGAGLGAAEVRQMGGTPALDVGTPGRDDRVNRIGWDYDPVSDRVVGAAVYWHERAGVSGVEVHLRVFGSPDCAGAPLSSGSGSAAADGDPSTEEEAAVSLRPVSPDLMACVRVVLLEV